MKFKDVSPRRGMLIINVAQEIDILLQAKVDASWDSFSRSDRWSSMRKKMDVANAIEFEATYRELYDTEVLPNIIEKA